MMPRQVQRGEKILLYPFTYMCRSRDRLLVWALDSWSKGCGFKVRQKQQVNFLLQSQLCVLTLIQCPFHHHVTAVARRKSQSFCQKVQVAGYTLTRIHLWPNEVREGWLCRCQGTVWEPTKKRAHTQLIREHSVTVISAHWATVD